MPDRENGLQRATFAAGCFWGVEEAFLEAKGVRSTSVGYTGGRLPNPTYEDVCFRDTGHAEAVEVCFDPSEVSFEELLALFWEIHDPTTLNRQGPDLGAQYRSGIFYHSAEQEAAARRSLEALEHAGIWRRPIVTEITPAAAFYPAEAYHQQYLRKMGIASCHI